MVEAAFLPGALFLISKWYKKDEIRSVPLDASPDSRCLDSTQKAHRSMQSPIYHLVLRQPDLERFRFPNRRRCPGEHEGRPRTCRLAMAFLQYGTLPVLPLRQ